MPTRYKNKQCLQVLIDNAKFQLLEQCAQDRGMKTSALARLAVYDWLSRNVDPELFQAAVLNDEVTRKQSIRSRVRSRLQNKASNATSDTPSDIQK